jgi:hypothetical protein
VDPSAICGVRWVHVFEEDSAGQQIYKPSSASIPLSRRPREALTLHRDGTATFEVGGADDRPVGRRAHWRPSGDGVVVEVPAGEAGGSMELHIQRASPERLVIAPAGG